MIKILTINKQNLKKIYMKLLSSKLQKSALEEKKNDLLKHLFEAHKVLPSLISINANYVNNINREITLINTSLVKLNVQLKSLKEELNDLYKQNKKLQNYIDKITKQKKIAENYKNNKVIEELLTIKINYDDKH